MRRRIGTALTLSALVAGGGAVAAGILTPTAHAQQTGGFDFSQPEVVASGLEIPWGLTFLPDGSAVTVERASAQVIQVSPGGSQQVLGTVPNVTPDGEGGLLGLAASPNFSQDGWLYAYHTSPQDNRIVRFQLSSPQNAQPVLTGITRGTIIHNGGRIQFGPDGMLYAATGDAGTGSNAQDLDNLAGKILRVTPEGNVPGDNPFPGSPILSYGHRNVQGLAWDDQGRLWGAEFGELTFDEVNLIEPGGNYGWPDCEGFCDPPNSAFIDPELVWSTAEASPSGAAFANGNLFVAGLRGQRLWVVPVNAGGAGTPTAELNGQFGRIRTVEVGPDGWLWITTSNQDGRGNPVPSDDRILRFPPVGGPSPTESPSPTASPTASPTTSPSPTQSPTPTSEGDCAAEYEVVNQWPGGFQGEVSVTNTGSATSSGWQVTWTFPNGQEITQLWGGVPDQNGASVTVDNQSWNGTLSPGASTTFGFLGDWNGTTNNVPTDVSCTLT